MQDWWRNIRNYLYFHRKERNGVLVLSAILLLFYTAIYLYGRLFPVETPDNTQLLAKIDSIEQEMKVEQPVARYFTFDPNTVDSAALLRLGFTARQVRTFLNYRRAGARFWKKEDFKRLYFVDDSLYVRYAPYITIAKSEKTPIQEKQKSKQKELNGELPKAAILFPFNPNTLSLSGWDSLGVSPKIARNVQKYISKGGQFRKPEDLQKIYGFSSEKYNELASFIRIPKAKNTEKKVVTKPKVIHLNTATVEDLQQNYIGKYTAGKIIKYRELLGGFVALEQLKEVRNMPQRDYDILQERGEILGNVRQLDLNVATQKELYSHPYISFRQAEDIVRYRKRKGKYSSVAQLREKKILPQAVFEKAKAYLFVKKQAE